VQGDVLSERPPVGEAWLLLIGTDLGLPGPALLTPTAAAGEWDSHPVADLTVTDLGAHLNHHPGELMTGHMLEHDLFIMSGPRMPALRHIPVAITRTTTPPAGTVGWATSRTSGWAWTASMTTARTDTSCQPGSLHLELAGHNRSRVDGPSVPRRSINNARRTGTVGDDSAPIGLAIDVE
jgi:hypothetical protein